MKPLCTPVLLLTVLLPAGLSTGCTAFGALVGTAADRSKEKVVKPAGDIREIHTLKDGAEVELRLRGGLSARGRYRGLDWTLTETRLSRYQTAGRALARDLALPAPGPGASLALTRDRDQVATGELVGYGPGFVVFRDHPESPPARVPLDSVVELADGEGRNIAGPRLAEVLSAAPIPVLAGVKLEQADEVRIIPFENVEAVGHLVRPRGGLKTGLILGGIVDALYLITVLTGQWG